MNRRFDELSVEEDLLLRQVLEEPWTRERSEDEDLAADRGELTNKTFRNSEFPDL